MVTSTENQPGHHARSLKSSKKNCNFAVDRRKCIHDILENKKRYAQSCDCERRKFIKDKDWHSGSHAHSVGHFVTSVQRVSYDLQSRRGIVGSRFPL